MDRASQTAIIAAQFRAAHVIVDRDPIFDDTLALAFADSSEDDVRDLFAQIPPSCAHVCRLFACQRARVTEEEVERAVQRGVTQYVDLGAGLDSFPWRRSNLMANLVVFEVDHPDTQSWKRSRLSALDLAIPPNLHFIGHDFSGHDRLSDRLMAAGFDPALRSVWSWLGVILYLPRPTIESTLRDVVALAAPGSELVASYRVTKELMDPAAREMDVGGTARAAELGEPQITWLDATEIEDIARRAGWSRARSIKPTQLTNWFDGRGDGLEPVSYEWIIVAEI